MKFLKVLCTLIFLLTNSSGFSFSSENAKLLLVDQEQTLSSEIDEGVSFTYDSQLTSPISYIKSSIGKRYYNSFLPLSCYRERIDNKYYIYSILIVPALDVSAIIFPFHSFL